MFRKLIACLALALGIGGVAVATNVIPASAQLSNCIIQQTSNPDGSFARCTTQTSPSDQMRDVISCHYGNNHVIIYGSWVNRGIYSIAQCYTGYSIDWQSMQFRTGL